MDIEIDHYIEGARKARGVAVIIDVFRAFSTACYIFGSGAEKILLAATPAEAFNLRSRTAGAVIAGERGGLKVEGFDYGNSPHEISRTGLAGRTVVLATSAGTRGVMAAEKADEIYTGSFVNAGATARLVSRKQPRKVTLVCMGWNGEEPADEDILYAEYMKGLLYGAPVSFGETARYLREESSTRKFTGKLPGNAGSEDLGLCLSLDRFDFALRAYGNELKQV